MELILCVDGETFYCDTLAELDARFWEMVGLGRSPSANIYWSRHGQTIGEMYAYCLPDGRIYYRPLEEAGAGEYFHQYS